MRFLSIFEKSQAFVGFHQSSTVLLLLCAKSRSTTRKFGVNTAMFSRTLPLIISEAVISSAALSVQIMLIVLRIWRRRCRSSTGCCTRAPTVAAILKMSPVALRIAKALCPKLRRIPSVPRWTRSLESTETKRMSNLLFLMSRTSEILAACRRAFLSLANNASARQSRIFIIFELPPTPSTFCDVAWPWRKCVSTLLKASTEGALINFGLLPELATRRLCNLVDWCRKTWQRFVPIGLGITSKHC